MFDSAYDRVASFLTRQRQALRSLAADDVSWIPGKRSGWRGWSLALMLVAISALAGFALPPWPGDTPFLAFFPAIFVSTLLCGWRHGTLGLALSTVAAWG